MDNVITTFSYAQRAHHATYSRTFTLKDGTSGTFHRIDYANKHKYGYQIDNQKVVDLVAMPAMLLALRYVHQSKFPVVPLVNTDCITIHISSYFEDDILIKIYYGNDILLVFPECGSSRAIYFAIDLEQEDIVKESFFALFYMLYEHRDVLQNILTYYRHTDDFDEELDLTIGQCQSLLDNVDKHLPIYERDIVHLGNIPLLSYLCYAPTTAVAEIPLYI